MGKKKIGHWFYRITTEDLKRIAGGAIIGIAAMCFLMWLLSSCSLSNKSRSSSRSSVDSSATSTKVTEAKSQEAATVDKSKDSSWESEVVIDFDNEQRAEELAGPKDTGIIGKPVSNDYRPITRQLPTGKVHKVKVNGKTIESNLPIKSATIRENGQTRQLDITEITRQDSGRQEEKGTVNVERKEQAKDRNSFSWRIPWWLYLLVIGGAVAAWRLGWFKRDPMDDFEIKYKRHGKNNITDQT